MQVTRLFEIIYTLLNKKSVTAKELAAQFGVSARTIYRDVDTLSVAGIPVYTEKGKNGGISLLPGFVLNKSILSENEQNEILNALHGLSHVRGDETARVLNRLSTIFNKTAANWLEVDFSDWSCGGGYFNELKRGILEHRITEIEYHNTNGERMVRLIEPMQLWFKFRAWYIKAFCLSRQAMRLFKLNRMGRVTVTDNHFTPRELTHIPEETNNTPPAPEVVYILRVLPEMAYRAFDDFNEDCIERMPDGSLIATAKWVEDNWLYGYLLSYGEYAEVLHPPYLREKIKGKLLKMAGKY